MEFDTVQKPKDNELSSSSDHWVTISLIEFIHLQRFTSDAMFCPNST